MYAFQIRLKCLKLQKNKIISQKYLKRDYKLHLISKSHSSFWGDNSDFPIVGQDSVTIAAGKRWGWWGLLPLLCQSTAKVEQLQQKLTGNTALKEKRKATKHLCWVLYCQSYTSITIQPPNSHLCGIHLHKLHSIFRLFDRYPFCS